MGMTLKQAVQTLKGEYYRQLKAIEVSTPHDRMEYSSADGTVTIANGSDPVGRRL